MEFHGGGGGLGGGGGGGSRAEAERWLEIAGKLLFARDLVGSKRFAERALESDPLVDGADQILAVADVLLASQSRVGSGRVDWYAVLGIPSGGGGADPVAVKRHYRRLALLLHPDRNKYPGADAALRLVVDAFDLLSDPSEKALFDAELHLDSSPTPAPAPAPSKPSPSKPSPSSAPAPAAASEGSAFWTACPSCCHVHQYNRSYQNRSLRCPNCHRPFHAAEIAVPPPIVPGTNMYYCAWGFFPLGFPTAADLTSGWKPFYPMFPGDPKQGGLAWPASGSGGTPYKGKAVGIRIQNSTPSMRNKKTMARKKVGVGPKRRSFGGGSEVPPPVAVATNVNEVRGININEEVKDPDVGTHVRGVDEDMNMMSFHIDVDATEEILGNLHHLPFLREEEVHVRMPKY